MTADQETPYTTVQKRDAIAQELASRLRVYQRRVLDGSMSRRQADEGIRVMRAILADYDAQVAKERVR
ncbi:MAG: hypothetical protein PVJ46_10525 [Methyloceanibacter sp.]|jgi:hypothetical protein